MWKDFRNLGIVLLTVFSVLGFSVYTRNKMDRNTVFYDNLVAIKEQIVQGEIDVIKQNKESERMETELLEAEIQKKKVPQVQKIIYVPPEPAVIVSPTPTPVVEPVKIVKPKPSRQTRAS